jgi:hypothetical protein
VKPTPQSQPPSHDASLLVLHLTARSLRKVPAWGEVPAEDWIVLTAAEWRSLLPSDQLRVGSTWTIQEVITQKLLRKFYPPMEELNSKEDRSRIETASLRSTVISATPRFVQVRLDGSLRMKRSFYTRRNDDNYVDATVVGFFEFDPISPQIKDFELATEKATYGPSNPEEFGAALSSVSAEISVPYTVKQER